MRPAQSALGRCAFGVGWCGVAAGAAELRPPCGGAALRDRAWAAPGTRSAGRLRAGLFGLWPIDRKRCSSATASMLRRPPRITELPVAGFGAACSLARGVAGSKGVVAVAPGACSFGRLAAGEVVPCPLAVSPG